MAFFRNQRSSKAPIAWYTLTALPSGGAGRSYTTSRAKQLERHGGTASVVGSREDSSRWWGVSEKTTPGQQVGWIARFAGVRDCSRKTFLEPRSYTVRGGEILLAKCLVMLHWKLRFAAERRTSHPSLRGGAGSEVHRYGRKSLGSLQRICRGYLFVASGGRWRYGGQLNMCGG